MVTLAPMPRPSVSTAIAVNPGLRTVGAPDEARAVGDAVCVTRLPLPLVPDVGAPLAAPLAAARGRREPSAGVDDRQQDTEEGTRARGHRVTPRSAGCATRQV